MINMSIPSLMTSKRKTVDLALRFLVPVILFHIIYFNIYVMNRVLKSAAC